MARYFFNLEREAESVEDIEGLDLANVVEARAEALALSRAVTDTLYGDQRDWSGWMVVVRDENRDTIEAIAIAPAERKVGRN